MLLRRPPSGPPSPGPVHRDVPGEEWALQYRTVHGYRRAFRTAGSGPVLLLIHGIGDDSSTWRPLLDETRRRLYLLLAGEETRPAETASDDDDTAG